MPATRMLALPVPALLVIGFASTLYFSAASAEELISRPPGVSKAGATCNDGEFSRTPDLTGAAISDLVPEVEMFDSFSGLTAPISAVRWWGLEGNFAGESPVPCTRSNLDFQLTFYTEAGGTTLGSNFAIRQGMVSRVDTGLNIGSFDLFEYSVTFDAPVSLADGWLSIRGQNDPQCFFVWAFTAQVDGVIYVTTSGQPIERSETGFDLAFCLITGAGG